MRDAPWFVCVVGAVDWGDGGSNCLMVGFMETLYNACDSLFSACQEEGGFVTPQWLGHSRSLMHLCTLHSQLHREVALPTHWGASHFQVCPDSYKWRNLIERLFLFRGVGGKMEEIIATESFNNNHLMLNTSRTSEEHHGSNMDVLAKKLQMVKHGSLSLQSSRSIRSAQFQGGRLRSVSLIQYQSSLPELGWWILVRKVLVRQSVTQLVEQVSHI